MRSRARRWLPWIAAALAAALAGYVAAGPFLTVRAIQRAVQADDARALARQVDFPRLRANLRAQAEDRLAREYGDAARGGLLGELGLRIAGGMAGGLVDALATPAGLAALMEGRRVWSRLDGSPPPHRLPEEERPRPFDDARYRYESSSRFTVTAGDGSGRPLVFVLTRDGLRWRLSDIRPEAADQRPATGG